MAHKAHLAAIKFCVYTHTCAHKHTHWSHGHNLSPESQWRREDAICCGAEIPSWQPLFELERAACQERISALHKANISPTPVMGCSQFGPVL